MPSDRILLVDDDPTILNLLKRFLVKNGYEVAVATTGHEALQSIRGQDFSVALLDLRLPDFSGLDLLSHLKGQSPETEVILFTGHGGLDSALQALRLGAYDYLVKAELRFPDLQAVIDRALEHRRLAKSNRELLANLRQAQEELRRRRARELAQIRQLGETLARPLTCEQLCHGLLTLIWEGLPLDVLGMRIAGLPLKDPWQVYRQQDHFSPDILSNFQRWLQSQLHSFSQQIPFCVTGENAAAPLPLPAMLCEKIHSDKVLGLVAAGRQEPFTPEESELFRIFALQGEAALTNLLLFEEVKNLAIRDGLTGLYNHRHFWELLTREVESCRRYHQPLSLIFLDIDNFKVINDTLGHPQGDAVLKGLADYLQSAVRKSDFPCRYGGEEFVVLLPQTAIDQAMVMAERLRAGIARTAIATDNGDIMVTVSIGVSGLTPDMDGPALVRAADHALYRAKQEGKNRVVGTSS